ncbi:MAG: GNVR domain-containing protein [Rhizobiaceae bacterium]
MFDASNRQSGKRDRSLLSLGASARREPAGPGSLLALAASEGPDPALRHRITRSRREAEPSPLLAALGSRSEFAAHDDVRENPPPADEARVEAPELRPEPKEPGGVRAWLRRLRDRMEAPSPVASGRMSEAAPEARPPLREPSPASAESAPAPGRPDVREERVRDKVDPEPLHAAATRDDYWRPMVDPFRVIGGVVRSRWIIVGATIAGAVLGVVIALSTPKLYQAYTELVVDPRDLALVDRELTTTGLPSDATLALVENQVRVLTSSTVLNKVVDRLGLDRDPEFNGEQGASFGPGTVIALIRSLVSGGADGGADAVRKRALAVEHLGKSLHVERGGKTFVIVISVSTQSGEKSALIANTMTEVFIQTSGELQSDTAGRATEELMSSIGELRGQVEDAERKVAAFKAENDIVDSQGRLITDDEIVKVNDQLTAARARTIELNARAASARELTVDAVASGALPEELASPVVIELRAQYATLKQEADRVGARLGPRHPTRVDVEAQLAGARDRLSDELRRVAASIQVALARAVQEEQALAARLAQLKARHGSLGEHLVTLRELERDATAKRSVYEAFLLRARETQEQMGINAANVTVISTAFPPLDPSGPSRSAIAVGATVLGFLIGVALGVVRGTWTSLRENLTGRPRRRRRARPVGDDPPPSGPRGAHGDQPEMPRREAETREDMPMGFIDRLRGYAATARRRQPAPEVAAPVAPPPAAPVASSPSAPPPAAHASAQELSPMSPYHPFASAPLMAVPPSHPSPAYAPVFAPPSPAMSVWPPSPQPLYPQAVAPNWYGVAPPPPPAMYVQGMAGHGPWVYPQPPAPAGFHIQPPVHVYASPPPAHYAPPPPAPPQYAAPMPAYAPPPPEVPAAPAPESRRPATRMASSSPVSTVDEIRDSLREVRDAMRELVEDRHRRRIA